MTKMLGRKTKLTQHGVTDEMSPRYTKELERQEAKRAIEEGKAELADEEQFESLAIN